MANTEGTNAALVVTRATYNNRKSAGTLLDDVLYLVIEPSSYPDKFLSLYLGKARVTDLIDLDGIIPISENETDFNNVNVPVTLPIKDKIYTLTDTINDVVRAYSCRDDGTTIPLYGTPVWE